MLKTGWYIVIFEEKNNMFNISTGAMIDRLINLHIVNFLMINIKNIKMLLIYYTYHCFFIVKKAYKLDGFF